MRRNGTLSLALLLMALTRGAAQNTWTSPAIREVDAVYPDVEALYFDLHRSPELAFQEAQTAAKLADRLKKLGYDVSTGVGRRESWQCCATEPDRRSCCAQISMLCR